MRPCTSFRSAPAQNTFCSERICRTVKRGPRASSSSLASNAATHSSLIAFTGGRFSVNVVTPSVVAVVNINCAFPAPIGRPARG